MFSAATALGIAVYSVLAVGMIDGGLFDKDAPLKKEINKLFRTTNLKTTEKKSKSYIYNEGEEVEVYAYAYDVQKGENYTDFLISLPFGKTYKDLEKTIPLFETHFGKECNMVRSGKYLAIRIKENNNFDRTYEFVINEALELAKVKNSKDEVAKVRNILEANTFFIALLDMPLGTSSTDLEKAAESLGTYFKNDVETYIDYDGNVGFKIYTKKLNTFYQWEPVNYSTDDGLKICVGVGREGVLMYNLTTGIPHVSIIGDTGSGKSTVLHSLMLNCMVNNAEGHYEFDLMDLKEGSELYCYRHAKDVCYYTDSVEDTLVRLEQLVEEMGERYKRIKKRECRNIVQYNKKTGESIKHRLIVIDEMFSFLNLENDEKKRAYDLLSQLGSKGRAAGFHLLITTQRPAADVIPKIVMDHIGLRIGLACSNTQKSMNAIDATGLEKIKVKGQGLINVATELTRFQGFYLSENEIEQKAKQFWKSEKTIQNERFERYINNQGKSNTKSHVLKDSKGKKGKKTPDKVDIWGDSDVNNRYR